MADQDPPGDQLPNVCLHRLEEARAHQVVLSDAGDPRDVVGHVAGRHVHPLVQEDFLCVRNESDAGDGVAAR
jgi:hypothetical protein